MSGDEQRPSGSPQSEEIATRVAWLRGVAAAGVALLLLIYLAAIVTGVVHADERLTPSDLGVVAIVLGVAVLLQPRLLGVVPTLVKVGTIEVQLDQIQQQQQVQRRDLEDLRLVFELLLTDWERGLLRELAAGGAAVHTGSEERRIQLRRLAGLKLIYRRHGRTVGEVTDGERRDFSEIFALTDRGRAFLARLAETTEQGA